MPLRVGTIVKPHLSMNPDNPDDLDYSDMPCIDPITDVCIGVVKGFEYDNEYATVKWLQVCSYHRKEIDKAWGWARETEETFLHLCCNLWEIGQLA